MKFPEDAWNDYVKTLSDREKITLVELMKMKAAFMAGFEGGLNVFKSRDIKDL